MTHREDAHPPPTGASPTATPLRRAGSRPRRVAKGGTAAGFLLAVAGAAVALGACTSQPGPPGAASGGADSGQSAQSQGVQMSGGYEVGPDGKLVRPPVSLTEPALPDAARPATPDGAESFARYFVAVTQYAWNSGDTARLRAISTQECEMCQSMIDGIEQRYRAGGWNDGLEYAVTQTEAPVPYPGVDGKYAVVIHVDTTPNVAYDGTRFLDGSTSRELIELHTCREDDTWRACGGTGAPDPDATS